MSEVKFNIKKSDFLNGLKLSPKALLEAQDFWVKRVQRVTRTGKFITTGKAFKSLSDAYVSFRASFSGSTSEFFKPKKSNLTFTGQLIDSLKGRSNFKQQVITVFASGKRTDGKSNKDVAKWVAENGRPFLGIDEKGIKRIEQIGRRDIRRSWRNRRR